LKIIVVRVAFDPEVIPAEVKEQLSTSHLTKLILYHQRRS
jgi:hypothetical protein